MRLHFDDEVALERDYRYLRHPEVASRTRVDRASHIHDGGRRDIERVVRDVEALWLLAHERWFVRDFASEAGAVHFMADPVRSIYFPDEPFPFDGDCRDCLPSPG